MQEITCKVTSDTGKDYRKRLDHKCLSWSYRLEGVDVVT